MELDVSQARALFLLLDTDDTGEVLMPKSKEGVTPEEEDHLASMYQTVKAGNGFFSTPGMTAVLTDLTEEEEEFIITYLRERRGRLVEMQIHNDLPWVPPEDVGRLREATGLKPLPPRDDEAVAGARHSDTAKSNRRKRRQEEREERKRNGGRPVAAFPLLCRHGAGHGEVETPEPKKLTEAYAFGPCFVACRCEEDAHRSLALKLL